jgi:hypothetical protein
LGWIHHFTINVANVGHKATIWGDSDWTVDLSGDSQLVTLVRRGQEYRSGHGGNVDYVDTFEQELQVKMSEVAQRPACQKLRKEDFEDVRVTLERALNALCAE